MLNKFVKICSCHADTVAYNNGCNIILLTGGSAGSLTDNLLSFLFTGGVNGCISIQSPSSKLIGNGGGTRLSFVDLSHLEHMNVICVGYVRVDGIVLAMHGCYSY